MSVLEQIVMDGPIRFNAPFDTDDFKELCASPETDILIRTMGSTARSPDVYDAVQQIEKLNQGRFELGQLANWTFSYLNQQFEARISIIEHIEDTNFGWPLLCLQVFHRQDSWHNQQIMNLIMDGPLFRLLIEDAKYLLLGGNAASGAFIKVAQWLEEQDRFQITNTEYHLAHSLASYPIDGQLRKVSVDDDAAIKIPVKTVRALFDTFDLDKLELNKAWIDGVSGQYDLEEFEKKTGTIHLFLAVSQLIEYINDQIMFVFSVQQEMSGKDIKDYDSSQYTDIKAGGVSTRSAFEYVKIEGLEGDARPMGKKSKLDENITPVFEGTLDRKAMAEALNKVMDDDSYSVRGAADAAEAKQSVISRIKDGSASLDKSAEVLRALGYEMEVRVFKPEN